MQKKNCFDNEKKHNIESKKFSFFFIYINYSTAKFIKKKLFEII
jgi:hypothetical protein